MHISPTSHHSLTPAERVLNRMIVAPSSMGNVLIPGLKNILRPSNHE